MEKKNFVRSFSDSISNSYTNLPKNKNKIFIKGIINEKDEAKRIYFL